MAELAVTDLEVQLQAYLNCLELCRAFQKLNDDPYVKEALEALIDDLQACLADLARHLRQRGVAPGTFQLDGRGKTRIREIRETRSLAEQMATVRGCLADLVARYGKHPVIDQTDPTLPAWFVSLSAQARHMLEKWDRHMLDMKAA
jgi:hypothetical protein